MASDSAVTYSPWSGNNSYEQEDTRQKHVVQPGESLSVIAEMYGIPAPLLAHHNGIPDPDGLMVGQVLYLPENNYPRELAPPSEPAAADEVMHDARPYAYFGNSEPVSDVLRNFAANYSIPVIISPNVDGVVNGRIGPLSPVEFLDKVAQLNGLIWYFDGNTLYVYNGNEIQKQILSLQYMAADKFKKTLMEIGIWDSRFYWKARPEEGIIYISGPPRYMELVTETAQLLDAKSGERQRSRQTVKVFPLRYAWADDRTFTFRSQTATVPGVATILRQIVSGGGLSSAPAQTPGRSVPGLTPATPVGKEAPGPQAPAQTTTPESVHINADRRLNSVIIHDLESKMPMYESLINTLDKPLAQVEINVSIIDVNTNNLDQLGINWRLGKEDGDFIRFNPFKSDNDSVPSNTFSTIINLTSGRLLTKVNILSDQGNAKVLARPSVLTLDNMEAVLDNSQTFYVRVAGQESAELFPVTYGSVLKVTPRIVDEVTGRKLHLSVNIQDGGQASSQEATGADNIPVVKNSSISTQAVIDENESLLVGGYYYEETRNDQSKIPVLGDMPLVGAAFRNKTESKKKNVRLFLITPRIVNLM
ncbi:type III secretion system outer membrane ring subunit SctC [Sansalvadorimonas verongulae]|uniref:type III secretion system outer membrane ring subunit SctC n=1 Tax=Sansalvadorimonas verongulae TaxID=2172824 RepID=UPI001E5C459D|nr:type III secretion system outer membrane ring subunit SctC [Sansalvadorimonas verongulae]